MCLSQIVSVPSPTTRVSAALLSEDLYDDTLTLKHTHPEHKGLLKRVGAFLRSESSKMAVSEQYDIQQKLGEGKFAVVKLGVDRETKEQWAIKIVDKTAKDAKMSMLAREVAILEKIAHPNVVFMREIYDTPDKLFIVLELVTGGELFKQIVDRGSYTEKDAAVIVRQIAEGLDYIHSQGVVHRDLKPENMLFSSPDKDAVIKLADFGLSNIVMDEDTVCSATLPPSVVLWVLVCLTDAFVGRGLRRL